MGWSTLVAAELIAATSGLGFMVQSAAQFLVTDVVVLGILVIALIAALFGFGGIAAGAVGIAKILFFVFVIMAVVTFVLGLLKKG